MRSPCWLWDGARDRQGYGRTHKMEFRLAHRLVFSVLVGKIPDGMTIDHLCNNSGCVNPDHMEIVTAVENWRRGPTTSGNKTHCPQGHEYTEANIKRVKSRPNARYCRACHRARSHA